MVADMTPGDLFDAAAHRSGDPVYTPADLWKIALVPSTRRRTVFPSPNITIDDTDGDEDGRSLPPDSLLEIDFQSMCV